MRSLFGDDEPDPRVFVPGRPSNKGGDMIDVVPVGELIERLEFAAQHIPFTARQWAIIAAILLPEEFDEPPEPEPSAARGRANRLALLESRAAKGLGLWHPEDDADAD